MKISFKSVYILTIATNLASVAFGNNKNKCSLQIGDRDHSDVRHRRMVAVNLPEKCESSDVIDIDIPSTTTTRSFKKVKSVPRSENAKSKGINASAEPNFGYWYGEDSNDGSTFNYVQDENGNIVGSMVDITNDSVMQFQIEDGVPTAIITASSDFPPEVDPEDVEDMDDPSRRLDTVNQAQAPESSRYGLRHGKNASSKLALINPAAPSESSNVSRTLYDDDGGNLDVMVVWTREAECRNSGRPTTCTVDATTTANMQARVNLAVAETNTAYQLSGVNTELLLVHSYMHPTYTESSFSGALYDLRGGVLDGVLDNRETYGADLVALLIDDPQYCGIAYVGPRIDLMFSVTAWNCATGYFSFGHEIGHNLGLLHDRGTSGECNGINYNYGYRDPNAQFRSILAYSCRAGQCDNNPANGSCTRVQRFSNPNFPYNGSPIGTATEDNARKINDVRVQVAGYKAHVSSSTPTAAPTGSSFDPPSSSPTKSPTKSPTSSPTRSPTSSPTSTPTKAPTGSSPTKSPTKSPTSPPTGSPTKSPISAPTGGEYVEVFSDDCEFYGYETLTSKDECTAAAAAVGRTVTWGPHGGYADVVTGCSARFSYSNTHLFFNNPGVCDPNAAIGHWTYTGCKCAVWMPCICRAQTTGPTCSDSPLRFKVNINGNKQWKTCDWAASDTQNCSYEGVSETCPAACGTCSTCVNSPLKFTVDINGIDKNKRCAWAARNPSRNCAFDGVKETCRSTCSACS